MLKLNLLFLAVLAALGSSCSSPGSCHTYAYGPAYGSENEGLVFPRPSHVADHGYPSHYEPIYHRKEPLVGAGQFGYGTDHKSQIPYLLR